MTTDKTVALVRYFCATVSILGGFALFGTQRTITLPYIVLILAIATAVASCIEAPHVVNVISNSSLINSFEVRDLIVGSAALTSQLVNGMQTLLKSLIDLFMTRV